MKTESRFYNFLIGTLSLMGVLALAGLLASCRLLEKPDAFDQMFQGVASQSAMQMNQQPLAAPRRHWSEYPQQ